MNHSRHSCLIYKQQHHNVCFLLPAVFFITIFAGCSVVPILESPRIRSGVKIETSIMHAGGELIMSLSDSVMRNSVYTDELTNAFGKDNVEFAPLVKLAFADRVEFGGYFWWVLLNRGWDGRIKVAVFEKGAPLLFRNLSGAAIVGTKGFSGEWGRGSRNWGGVTLGTRHRFRKLELEYVLMPTAGKSTYSSIEPDIGRGGVSFYDITLATGILASICHKFYSSIAVTATNNFTQHVEIPEYAARDVRINRVWFNQAPLGYHLVIGYRFGPDKYR